MAITAQKSVAALMQKTLDRQAAVSRMKFKLKENQIHNILLSHVRNEVSAPYSELLAILKSYPVTDKNFTILFKDCIASVVLLGRELKGFVNIVCNLEWIERSDEEVQLYSKFVVDLVTAHTYHTPLVMTALVKLFKADGENWHTTPPEDTVKRWSYIHTIIAQIVAVMPMTSDILLQTVIDLFPYYKAGVFANRSYIHNLIWMTKYIPSLMEQIMSAIVNRMVIMDVNAVDCNKNRHQQPDSIFTMDIEEPEPSLDETLDYAMLEMLQWLEDEKDPALQALCGVFERIILPTHGIRHVQFLLLYTISINQQCADRVLSNLWTVMAGLHGIGPGALATRRTASSHLAGLLARCVRVPNSRMVHYLKSMCDWCQAYVTAAQESTANDNAKVHGAFYAICHAVFYLVAFKHQHLFMSKESINFVESLNLPRLVTCPLNPLRSCPPQVARQFAAVTRQHQLVHCQAILERNARLSLHAPAVHTDHWFPYDPYTLPRSGKTIWPLCIEYKDWVKDGDDETQYSSRVKKIDADEDDFLMASPSAKLASSLSNCVSPGFKSM